MRSTRRLTGLLLCLLAAAIAGGCGSGDDESATAPVPPDSKVPADSKVPRIGPDTTGGVAVGGGGRVSVVGRGASKIRIKAAPEGLAYTTDHVESEAGETLLRFENQQSAPHDVDLEDANGKPIADMELIGGGYADVPIADLKSGEYTFYCSVPGHREAGMEGTVTVR
jgi:uncharacterized cupredoxin-like copper-binding protein